MAKLRAAAIRREAPACYTDCQIEAWVGSVSRRDFPGQPGDDGSHIGVVACLGRQLIGFGGLRMTERPHVWMTYVHPIWHRRGVGRGVMRFIEAIAVGHGYRRLEVAAALNAVEFYGALGYSRGAEFKVVLPTPLQPDGACMDVVAMSRVLHGPSPE